MKFTCNQQILTKALNTVSKAVTSRTTIPLLKGILLSASASQGLKMAASDLDLSIEKTVEANIIEEGSLVVSAKLFSDIVRKLPSEEVEVWEEENNTVVIRCLASEFKIVGQPADDFPSPGQFSEDNKMILQKDVFKEMIKKTSFSASIDESKGIITGVLIEMEEDSLTFAALDGFRMAVAKEKAENQQKTRIIVHAKILNDINKILSDMEEENELILILDNKMAVIRIENTQIVMRLLEGEFIKYRDIIPKEQQCRIKANRGELLECIERASLLAKEGKNNLIKISVAEEKLVITSRSEEGNVREELLVEKEGTNLDIGFNAKYVIDVLKAVSDEEIIMELNSSVSPCLMKPVDGDAFEYLVLPVRINVS